MTNQTTVQANMTDRQLPWNKCQLNHCLECISSFNTHLSHSRPWFNICI